MVNNDFCLQFFVVCKKIIKKIICLMTYGARRMSRSIALHCWWVCHVCDGNFSALKNIPTVIENSSQSIKRQHYLPFDK